MSTGYLSQIQCRHYRSQNWSFLEFLSKFTLKFYVQNVDSLLHRNRTVPLSRRFVTAPRNDQFNFRLNTQSLLNKQHRQQACFSTMNILIVTFALCFLTLASAQSGNPLNAIYVPVGPSPNPLPVSSAQLARGFDLVDEVIYEWWRDHCCGTCSENSCRWSNVGKFWTQPAALTHLSLFSTWTSRTTLSLPFRTATLMTETDWSVWHHMSSRHFWHVTDRLHPDFRPPLSERFRSVQKLWLRPYWSLERGLQVRR